MAEWHNPIWRGNQAGAMQNPNWENSSCSITVNQSTCNQGSVPIFAVNATLPEHVQATIRWVSRSNLRLVMKTTGHDYLGRSTAAGSLLLWLHHIKDRRLIERFSSCTGKKHSNVIRLGAGVQWGEVYQWLAPYNLTAIGGASGTVGATGGFLQGGGHGPLTRLHGLAADQVLEFDVVLADGRRERVNECENSDLFWALRGGGAGTFAVVLSVLLRTYPSPTVVASLQRIHLSNASDYAAVIHRFTRFLSKFDDDGWTGYFYISGQDLTTAFFLPNANLSTAYASIRHWPDWNVTEHSLIPFGSFYEVFRLIFEPTNPTGGNVLLGSRLIPGTIVRNEPTRLAETFLRLNDGLGSILIGHLVAGGRVSQRVSNNSINPAWRTALLHMIYSQSWPDGTTQEDQTRLARHVTAQVDLLQTVAGGGQSGAYMNEADRNEPHWQQKFFGSDENYRRLKAIKQSVDPRGLFVCAHCVGSDDWSEDLNCPRTSTASAIPLLFTTFVGSLYFPFCRTNQ